MNYIDLIPVLIRAIQEQEAQIDTLSASSEPRPSGALDMPPLVEASAPVVPQVTVIRQSVGPSNVASFAVAGALALGLCAVAGPSVLRAPRRVV